MSFRSAKVLKAIAVLLPLGIVLSVISFGRADSLTSTPGWFGGMTPTVNKSTDLAVSPSVSNRDCTSATIQIDNTAFGSSSMFEDHCYVRTTNGLVEQEGAYIQPPGYAKAYRTYNAASGGNQVLIPIPNQAGALWLRGSDTGVTLQYFKDLYNHLGFDYFYQRFNITSLPELTFSYANHTPMQFNYGTLAMDPNGRYMMVDTIFNGIVKIDTLNLNAVPISASFPSGPGLNSTAINTTGKLAVVSHDGPGEGGGGYFKVIDVDTCQSLGTPVDSYQLLTSTCTSVNLYSQLAQSIPQLASITNVRFANDRTLTFVAKTGTASSNYKFARYSITAGGQALSLVQYEALGDSYISGEGALNYRSGTNTERNGCHQSLVSYPYLLSGQFSSFADVACSGAEMHNLVRFNKDRSDQLNNDAPSDDEINTARQSHLPGVILQNEFVTQDNPDAITLSIGGNDIGFADIIEKCINPFQGNPLVSIGHLTCYDTYEDRLELVNTINEQFPRLRDLYEGLKSSATGDRRVYVVGYPQVMKAGGNCGLNVAMNAREVAFAHDLTEYLDSVIRRAASEAGVGYVDTQHTFDGYKLCEGTSGRVAVNGLTINKQPFKGLDIKGSFHPNALGHELLAGAVASQTRNMTNSMPAPSPKTTQIAIDPDAPILQNVPHTGRAIRKVNNKLSGLGELVLKQASFQLIVNSRDFFTKPGTTYTVGYGNNLSNLGSFIADAFGNVTISSSLPADTPVGYQTIHVYGNDIFGKPIDLQEVVYVASTNDDYDNDGVPNDRDSCPLATQSGTDADQDGIDDVCDPQVTVKPVVTIPDDIVWQRNAILYVDIYGVKQPSTASP